MFDFCDLTQLGFMEESYTFPLLIVGVVLEKTTQIAPTSRITLTITYPYLNTHGQYFSIKGKISQNDIFKV